MSEENAGYTSVQITDSELAALNSAPTEQPAKVETEKKEPATEAKPVETEEQEETPVKIKIGKTEYAEDEVKGWFEDSQNKKSWQAKNTQTAQELAEQRKAVEPLVTLINKLRGTEKEAFVEMICESFMDDPDLGEDAVKSLKDALKFDPEKYEHPFKKELAEERAKREQLEAEKEANRLITEESDVLKKNYKLSDKKVKDVIAFAVKKYEDTSQAISLEDAYKLVEYEDLKKKSQEPPPPPKVPTVPPKGQGAKEFTEEPPKGIKQKYAEVNLSGVNLFDS